MVDAGAIHAGKTLDWTVRINHEQENSIAGQKPSQGPRESNDLVNIPAIDELGNAHKTKDSPQTKYEWMGAVRRHAPHAHASIFRMCLQQIAFERVETALEKQGSGPFFNGAKYSLVDAAYAPFLQRYYFLDRVKKLGLIEKYPRLKAWMEALLARPSTHSFPAAEFEAMYREGLRRRNKWVSRFIEPARAAAE